MAILLELILAMDAHGLRNKIDIIGDTEIIMGFMSGKGLVAIMTYRHQPLRAGLGSFLKALLANQSAAFGEPANGPTAAAKRVPAVVLHFPERHPGQLSQHLTGTIAVNTGVG